MLKVENSTFKKYRKNVGICLFNKDKQIFAANRFKNISLDGWQMPQGGVESLDNENLLLEGMHKELYEEVGLKEKHIKIIKKSYKIKYEFPQEILKKINDKSKQNIVGQEQVWFLLEFLGEDKDINLEVDKENQEFFSWKWVDKEFLIQNVIEMKKDVYKEILTLFFS